MENGFCGGKPGENIFCAPGHCGSVQEEDLQDPMRQLLERAGRSDGEEWVRQCLQSSGVPVPRGVPVPSGDTGRDEVTSQARAEDEAALEDDDVAQRRRSMKRQRRSFSPSEYGGGRQLTAQRSSASVVTPGRTNGRMEQLSEPGYQWV